MGFTGNIKDLLRFGIEITKDRDKDILLEVIVEADAAAVLLDLVQEVLSPHTVNATVDVRMVGDPVADDALVPDAKILIAGSGLAAARSEIKIARALFVPVVVVAFRPAVEGLDLALGQPIDDLLVASDPDEILQEFASWLADKLASKRLSLATNFPFSRCAVAEEFVKAAAWQNALVGTVAIIPGADMPLMTANQAKMLLRIAAAYGEGSRLRTVNGSGLID